MSFLKDESSADKRRQVLQDPRNLEEILTSGDERKGKIPLCQGFCARYGSDDACCFMVQNQGRLPADFCDAFELTNASVEEIESRVFATLVPAAA